MSCGRSSAKWSAVIPSPCPGRQIRVDTRSEGLRRRFADAAAEERSGVARVLSALGVPHVVLSTSGDWLRTLAAFLGTRR